MVTLLPVYNSVKAKVGAFSEYCVSRNLGDSSIDCRMLELERGVVTSAATSATATSSTASDSGVGSEESGGLGYSGGKGDAGGDTAGDIVKSNKVS